MTLRCILIDDEPYALVQLEELIALIPGLSVIGSFENAFDAINYLHNNAHVDIVFCDISMPFINGLEAGKILNGYCQFLIYITAHREYGAEASELNAAGYLLKPIRKVKFIEKIEDVILKIKNTKQHISNEQFLYLKGSLKNNYISISYDRIMYIQSESNYISVKTIEGNHLSYMSLGQIEKHIGHRTEFVRINRSTILSMFFFDHVDGYTIYLKDKSSFTIGRSHRAPFFDFLKSKLINPKHLQT